MTPGIAHTEQDCEGCQADGCCPCCGTDGCAECYWSGRCTECGGVGKLPPPAAYV